MPAYARPNVNDLIKARSPTPKLAGYPWNYLGSTERKIIETFLGQVRSDLNQMEPPKTQAATAWNRRINFTITWLYARLDTKPPQPKDDEVA